MRNSFIPEPRDPPALARLCQHLFRAAHIVPQALASLRQPMRKHGLWHRSRIPCLVTWVQSLCAEHRPPHRPHLAQGISASRTPRPASETRSSARPKTASRPSVCPASAQLVTPYEVQATVVVTTTLKSRQACSAQWGPKQARTGAQTLAWVALAPASAPRRARSTGGAGARTFRSQPRSSQVRLHAACLTKHTAPDRILTSPTHRVRCRRETHTRRSVL